MGKQKKLKQQRRINPQIKYVIVKSVWQEPNGTEHPDYQLLEAAPGSTLDQIQREILSHAQSHHPEYRWTVEVYDADNIPPNTIPEGTKFTLPL